MVDLYGQRMKGLDVTDVLIREEVYKSNDQEFFVKLSFATKELVELYPSGHANSQRFSEVYQSVFLHLQKACSYLKERPLYIVIHLDKVQVASSLKEFFRNNFNNSISTPQNFVIAFVCKGFFSRLFWKVWLKNLTGTSFQVFKSLEKVSYWSNTIGYSFSGQEDKAVKEAFFSKEVVQYQNETFYLSHHPDWHYSSNSGSFQYVLVNDEVVLLNMEGEVNKTMIDESVRIGKEVVKDLQGKRLINILELTKVVHPNWKTRKYAMTRGEETDYFWKHRIMIAHPLMAFAYNTLKIAFPKYAAKTILVTSFKEAIAEYISLKHSNNTENPEKTEKKKKKKSRKELEDQIVEMEKNQQFRIQQLFQVFSKISWDDQYEPLNMEVNERDPFYKLFYAVNYFQQDIYEIINDQKEQAQTLEEKVNERTKELSRKNKDLEKANFELVKVNKELDHFVYSVSHDLRAPIASMKGLINLLQLDHDPETHRLYHSMISKNLDRLDFFIVEILELSRNSRLPVHKEAINFEEIIENVFSELEHLGNANIIEKKVEINPECGFTSDKQRIIIVFRNLLSNAIKYSMPKYREPFIRLNITINKKGACIRVEDNGRGIGKEHQTKIFDMFYRATDQEAGSGLGLYIVKEMVDKLQGAIEVQSESNQGTTFIINLPNH